MPEPDLQDGIDYWKSQPATLDGVLGGFGSGSLPRIDSLGSRQFLMYLLCRGPSAIRPLALDTGDLKSRRFRALDAGAGIGRVTSDVLLHLVSDVVLLEPVDSFIQEAYNLGQLNANTEIANTSKTRNTRWKGISDKSNSVTFLQGTLQDFDPNSPFQNTKYIGHVGCEPPKWDVDPGFDIIWCQWCLGHLNDEDLVAFLQRSKRALRPSTPGDGNSVIVVKENTCANRPDGSPRTVFDEADSSMTRSDMAWKKIFADAGLNLVQERVQKGLPQGLYGVKMYALRP